MLKISDLEQTHLRLIKCLLFKCIQSVIILVCYYPKWYYLNVSLQY